jgi:hypothetical protein
VIVSRLSFASVYSTICTKYIVIAYKICYKGSLDFGFPGVHGSFMPYCWLPNMTPCSVVKHVIIGPAAGRGFDSRLCSSFLHLIYINNKETPCGLDFSPSPSK